MLQFLMCSIRLPQGVCETLQMVKLRGARAVVVGIHPDVAFTMVQLGLTLHGIETAIDLEHGLSLLNTAITGGSPSHE